MPSEQIGIAEVKKPPAYSVSERMPVFQFLSLRLPPAAEAAPAARVDCYLISCSAVICCTDQKSSRGWSENLSPV